MIRAPLGVSSCFAPTYNNAGGWLLVAFFALAPWVPGAVTSLAGLLAIWAMANGWKGGRLLHRETRWLLVGAGLYVATALLSLFNNQYWPGAGWRFEKYYPFILAIPVMGSLALLGSRLEGFFLSGISLSGLLTAAYSVYQILTTGSDRIGWTSGLNPNILGHLCSLVAIVLTGWAVWGRHPAVRKTGMFACALLALMAMSATGSRGGVLAFLAGLAAMLLVSKAYSGKNSKLIGLVAVGVTLLLLLVALKSEYWQVHWHRLMDETVRIFRGDLTSTSISERAVMWLAGWKIGQANPWFGTGIGDTQLDLDQLMATGALPRIENASYAILHNIFFDCFASTGTLGLLAMLFGIFILPTTLFWKCLRSGGSNPTVFVASVTGIAVMADNLVFGLTNSWLYLRGLPFVLILVMCLLVLAFLERVNINNKSADRCVSDV